MRCTVSPSAMPSLVNRVAEIDAGDCKAALEAIMNTPLEEQKNLYNHREIEK